MVPAADQGIGYKSKNGHWETVYETLWFFDWEIIVAWQGWYKGNGDNDTYLYYFEKVAFKGIAFGLNLDSERKREMKFDSYIFAPINCVNGGSI